MHFKDIESAKILCSFRYFYVNCGGGNVREIQSTTPGPSFLRRGKEPTPIPSQRAGRKIDTFDKFVVFNRTTFVSDFCRFLFMKIKWY